MVPSEIVSNVKKCSACGSDHDIEFTRLREPEVIDGETFGYWGVCENTQIEVFLRHDHNKETKVVQGTSPSS